MKCFRNHHRLYSQDAFDGLGVVTDRSLNDWRSAGVALSLDVAKKAICALLLASFITVGWAGEPALDQPPSTDITKLSLEDLMNAKVTSVSKKEEKLSQTAAAVYVITQEDIRRSGATSIPELLRMVPGLDVARIDAHQWAISARGFNDRFANKMLVLIDGRSVYTPMFSGVYWDVQDTLLEDVARIEVIRGPGATVWGANAVNGVINVITKSAKDTQGGLVTAGGGSEERGFGGARYGGKLGNAYYRFYGKYFNRNHLVGAFNHAETDQWDVLRGGARVDWNVSHRDSLTLQGDIYHGRVGEASNGASSSADSTQIAGGNLLARWTRTFSDHSNMALQLYYDRAQRDDVDIREALDTFDLDFQHRFALSRRQDVVWGLGYRFITDDTRAASISPVSFNPQGRSNNLFSAFIQDEFTLVKDRLYLTLGSKFEHNDYTGFEVQPSIRLAWTPRDHHTLWAAVSRAVRTPARSDRDLRINLATFPGQNGLPTVRVLLGNPNIKSEDLLAYELGYRVQPRPHLSLDIATFYNSYNNLRTTETGSPFFESRPLPPHLVIPRRFTNQMRGGTYGIEIAPSWSVTDYWKLSAGYTWLHFQLHDTSPILDTDVQKVAGSSPKHQVHLRSYLRLPRNLEFDTALYYVDRLVYQGAPSYTRLDARFGWRPLESLELSIGLQNLLNNRHNEFGTTNNGAIVSQIKRSIYGKIIWRF